MIYAAFQNLLAGDLNSVGLVVGFIGVLLIFFCGLPPIGVLNDGAYIAIPVTRKMKIYMGISKFGLLLVATGFFCQFLAVQPR